MRLSCKFLFRTLAIACLLTGCQTFYPQRNPAKELDHSLAVLGSPQSTPHEVAGAAEDYRRALSAVLPGLLKDSPNPAFAFSPTRPSGYYLPATFSHVTPVRNSRDITPGLDRPGLGLPAIGQIAPGGENSPRAGFHVPVTVLAFPKKTINDSFEVLFADPARVASVRMAGRDFPVAMNLAAALDATRATGPRLLDGLGFLLRPERLQSRLVFLQPYDPKKIPVVLIHGLISTPKMWAPVVKTLLADREIRRRYQFWFFYYPTGQPVPLSALQLREALDEAAFVHRVRRPMILVGHSMGGVLARAQVSRLTTAQAEEILPNVSNLPPSSRLRRCLVFEPRRDVSRVIFICTPHRGSRLAVGSFGGLAISLIRLPGWIAEEMADFAGQALPGIGPRLPTSIHGLSPYSRFLGALSITRPASPSHSIIGKRDVVVPLSSSQLNDAESEVFVPAGHGGFAHPQAIQEIRRILKTERSNN